MPSNFNRTTPVAPTGRKNVKWQTDGSGNDSAYYDLFTSVNPQVGTSYAIKDSATTGPTDRGTLVTLKNAGAVAVSIGQAGGSSLFPADWSCFILNLGAGTVTLTPSVSTVNGAATLALPTGAWCMLFSDGANYEALVVSSTGVGSVTSVAMTGDGVIFNSSVGGSPITTTGTLVPALLAQTKNTFLGGPSSGSNATPTFRVIAGADLPNPSASTLGGVQSYAAVTNQWINAVSTSGVHSSSQPTLDQIASPAGNITWTMTGDTLAFNWGSTNTNKLSFDSSGNPTIGLVSVATAVTNSPTLTIQGSYENAATPTYAADNWTIQAIEGAGLNGNSELKILHSGTTGVAMVEVTKLTVGASPTGGLGFDGTKATSAIFPAVFGASAQNVFNFVPSVSAAVNQPCVINIYTGTTATPSLSWAISAYSNNGGHCLFDLEAALNTSGQAMVFGCAMGTAAGVGILLSGNGGSNNVNFTATSGTQEAVRIGGDPTGQSNVAVVFKPASGTASFIGLNVNPTINQTGTASGSYTGLRVNVIETALLGTANLLLDLQAGTTGGTSRFSVDNTGQLILPNASNTATSATAGANGAAPSQVVGYIIVTIAGTARKIPYYAT
jgi:hypothetical protein